MTSPGSGATFTAGATITLTASASDSDGTIASVGFYAGTTLLGTSTAAPYSVALPNVSVGAYSFSARATDNAGATTTSSAVSVTVNAPPPPPPPPGLPAGWAHADIGAVPIAGDATALERHVHASRVRGPTSGARRISSTTPTRRSPATAASSRA